MAKLTIPVSGMHCASCQSRVQSALAKTPGVSDASVNLMLNNATVAYDPAVVEPHKLVAAIKATGYDAEVPAPSVSVFDEQKREDEEHARELADLKRKTGVSL